MTDEKGKFEITSVPRGEFLLVLNHDGKLSSREPFKKFYYPNVTGPEQAAVISIRPGEIINDIDVVVPSLVETITVEGVLRFSDGKPVADRWIEFKASQKENVSGDVTEKSDENGRFSLKILKGLKGDLSSEMYVYRAEFEDCPKLDELIKKGGRDFASIKTNSLAIEADDNIYNLELAFPFPGCKKKEQR
ncbi:MAG: hypothetical protein QOK48_2092 [Blastocatellia bacterium]|nr:hypothetical protein [Blastocatellia bacterium]